MEKHFCDLQSCGKEISTTYNLELRSLNPDIQKRFGLTGEVHNVSGKYTYFEFCSEDCLIDFVYNTIEDVKGILNGMGKQLKSVELVL